VHSEIKITEQTSHPRIARLYEAIETPKRMHLIMECLDGGNLCSYVKQKRRLSEDESRRIFFQLIQSIDYLHVMGVAHRDIKLENVLFGDTKDIKLIDFGFSTVTVPGKKLRVFCGTPSYMAPEIVRRVEYEGKPTDMWSLGILLYALLCGCFPFRAKTYPDLYRRIARGTFTVPDELSVSVRDLLRQLLNIEPTQRITAAAALRHPWLQSQFAQAPDINKMRLESTILVSDRPTDDIDDQLLAQMEEFGLSEKEVTQLIMTKTHTSITTLYYLLLDVLISERRRSGNRKALPSGLNTLRKQGNMGGAVAGTGNPMNIVRTNQQSGQGGNTGNMEMHYVTSNGVPVVLNGSGGGHSSRPKSAGTTRPSQSAQQNQGGQAPYLQQQAGGTVHLQQQITSNIPQRPLSAAAGRRS
jgi:serine/threonine protein kinase